MGNELLMYGIRKVILTPPSIFTEFLNNHNVTPADDLFTLNHLANITYEPEYSITIDIKNIPKDVMAIKVIYG